MSAIDTGPADRNICEAVRDLINHGKYQTAIRTLKKSLEDHPGDSELNHLMDLARAQRILLNNGNYTEAVRRLKKLLQSRPDDTEAGYVLDLAQSIRLIAVEKYCEAEGKLSELKTDRPEDADVSYWLEIAQVWKKMESEDYETASEKAKALLNRNPDDPQVAHILGIASLHLGIHEDRQKFEEAHRAFGQISSASSGQSGSRFHAENQVHLGVTLAGMGYWAEATQTLQQAVTDLEDVRVEPQILCVAIDNLTQVYLETGCLTEAMETCEKRIRLTPLDPGGYLFLAEAHLRSENPQEAITNYRKAAELLEAAQKKPDQRYYFNLGLAYFREGQIDKAIAYLKEFYETGRTTAAELIYSNTHFPIVKALPRQRYKQQFQMEPEEGTELPLVGHGFLMRQVEDKISKVVKSQANVFIHGETGTGKEIVARLIHQRSDRSDKPFVDVDLSSIEKELIGSTLFGHVEGAYTDAKADRQGLLRKADGGVLFLDEIGELSLENQKKLLRVIEQRRFRPVGSDEDVKVDIRLICATNRDLEASIKKGEFRDDLYYRINVAEIKLPPLRQRVEDIPELTAHFLRIFATRDQKSVRKIQPVVLSRLKDFDWPGNVRQLSNAIEYAVLMSEGDTITKDCLPDYLISSFFSASFLCFKSFGFVLGSTLSFADFWILVVRESILEILFMGPSFLFMISSFRLEPDLIEVSRLGSIFLFSSSKSNLRKSLGC